MDENLRLVLREAKPWRVETLCRKCCLSEREEGETFGKSFMMYKRCIYLLFELTVTKPGATCILSRRHKRMLCSEGECFSRSDTARRRQHCASAASLIDTSGPSSLSSFPTSSGPNSYLYNILCLHFVIEEIISTYQ